MPNEERDTGFKVVDRRPFTEEGKRREEGSTEKAHETVGHHAANHQRKQRVGIAAELKEENDGGERCAGDSAEHCGHGHQCVKRRVTNQMRKKVMPRLGVHGAHPASHDQRGREDPPRRA